MEKPPEFFGQNNSLDQVCELRRIAACLLGPFCLVPKFTGVLPSSISVKYALRANSE